MRTGTQNWIWCSEPTLVPRTDISMKNRHLPLFHNSGTTKNQPPTKAEITDWKSFRHKVYVWKAGKREKRKKTRPVYSLMKGNDSIHRERSDVGTKKSKLIKTVLSCIFIGLIALMFVNNTISINNNKSKSYEIKMNIPASFPGVIGPVDSW